VSPIRVIVMTSSRFGSASFFLRGLVEHPDIDVVLVVQTLSQIASRKRLLKRTAKKMLEIGPLGAVAGYYMRDAFSLPEPPDLKVLAEEFGIRFETTPLANGERTVELFREANADLGLSLGNGMIFPKVFTLPRFGMINIHGEILPDFRGAASVIWNLHEGVTDTGFTVHQIDRKIDTGAILYEERYPILFRPTLKETVRFNCMETTLRASGAFPDVVADYERLSADARPQGPGRSFTTPTFRQFLRIHRQHRRMAAESRARGQG
jgi:methionyl-tRNA formyltransferase